LAIIALRREFGISRIEASRFPKWELQLFIESAKKLMGVDPESLNRKKAAELGMEYSDFMHIMGDNAHG